MGGRCLENDQLKDHEGDTDMTGSGSCVLASFGISGGKLVCLATRVMVGHSFSVLITLLHTEEILFNSFATGAL